MRELKDKWWYSFSSSELEVRWTFIHTLIIFTLQYEWISDKVNYTAIFRVIRWTKCWRHNESIKWWWRLSSTSCSVLMFTLSLWLTHWVGSPFSLELKLYHQTIICLSAFILCSCHLYIFFAHINSHFQLCFFQDFFSRFFFKIFSKIFFQILTTNFKIFV